MTLKSAENIKLPKKEVIFCASEVVTLVVILVVPSVTGLVVNTILATVSCT